ncbi:helix-turn-helix domain-containing protein [Nocardia sp. NPDC058058]|uniref:helix-turn-helix domain-containing protein n=1 Tax=Nocardia sp. NPDC058058 TaxID=3346317 RepID=UPI0036D90D72
METDPTVAAAIAQIAPRLRAARDRTGISLAALSRATGISTSTLSRLESGLRKPSLELLLPVVAALDVPLDAIVTAPRITAPRAPKGAEATDTDTGGRAGVIGGSADKHLPAGAGADSEALDPVVPQQPDAKPGRVLIPLSRHPAEPRAYKLTIPAHDTTPYPRSHPGHEWLYVLRGQLRVRLGEHDFTMTAGEAAEFDCRIPHWFGATGRDGVEVLSLFGRHGARIHTRTRSR